MRKINIEGLKIFAYHGVNDEEKQNGQNFYINASLKIRDDFLSFSDDICSSVNYAHVCKHIIALVTENNWDLIESVAENITKSLLNKYEEIESIDVEVFKPEAPMSCDFKSVSVSVCRKWHKAVIAFGSNMGDKKNYIETAIDQIKKSEYFRNINVSSIIKTEAYGYEDQDDFLNGALVCETFLTAQELLKFLQKLEDNAGRKRDIHWGPRTLDLDIIFFDDEIIHTDTLIVPHYDIYNRYFVLKPLSELIPNFIHPVCKKTISQLLEEIKND